jgi:hypothetical protein
MVLTIHQPEHLPWLGYYNKMATADKFVILDGVQFRKNYFQNRNRVMGSNGAQWLVVPVELTKHSEDRICDMKIANTANPKWREKYLRTIEYGYKKHPYFNDIFPFFEDLLSQNHELLCDFNLKIIMYFADLLNIHPEFVKSSDLKATGLKTDLIFNICQELGASTYVAGPSGRDYLRLEDFENAGIKVVYNDFEHPEYIQKNQSEFVPYLSVLDLLMNVDIEEAKEIVCGKRFWKSE